jgi:hypothetical protein
VSDDPIDRLAGAVFRAFNPDPLDQLAEAISAAFAGRSSAVAADQDRQLALADSLARWRELQARQEAKYGPTEELFDRLQARGRGGLSGQVWC